MFYEGLRFWEGRFGELYDCLRLWEAHLFVFHVSGRLSGGSVSNEAGREDGSAEERPSRAWGEGEAEEGAGIIMSSNDVRLICMCFTCRGGSGRFDLSCFMRV